jgi:O-antigen ligase
MLDLATRKVFMENMLTKSLVFLFFLTFPLYAIDEFRLWIGPVSVTINLLILAVVMAFFILSYLVRPTRILIDKDVKFFINLIFLFVIYHFFSCFFSHDINLGGKYVFRIFGSLLIFVLSYIFASMLIFNEQKFNNLLIIATASSTVVLLIYIYRYAVIFHSPYLGTEWFFQSESGKNQLQIYLLIILPVIYYVSLRTKNKTLLIGMFIHIVAAIYVGSRGLWLSFFIVFALYFLRYASRFIATLKISRSLLQTILGLGAIILLCILSFSVLSKSTGFSPDYFYEKFQSVATLQPIAGHTNMSMRKEYIFISLNYLLSHPLFGIGLGNFEYNIRPTHNDYAFFLSDMGIIGFLLFIGIIGYSLHLFYLRKLPLYLILPFYVNLLFINAYVFPFFWLICGIILGINRKHKVV